MRDRLIELLKAADKRCDDTKRCEDCVGFGHGNECVNHLIADHLLAEGVIVPSNKPLPLIDEGDRVLCPICETDLMGCYFGYEESPTVVTCYGCGAWIDNTKAVTREEAEKALAERSGE